MNGHQGNVDAPPEWYGTVEHGPEGRDSSRRATASPERLLDCLLAMLERRELRPTEARLLLWLADREATPSELSEALDQTPDAIERATRRLDMRGLIRRRFERGRRSRFIFSITSAGLLWLRPLVQCVAETGSAGADDLDD